MGVRSHNIYALHFPLSHTIELWGAWSISVPGKLFVRRLTEGHLLEVLSRPSPCLAGARGAFFQLAVGIDVKSRLEKKIHSRKIGGLGDIAKKKTIHRS